MMQSSATIDQAIAAYIAVYERFVDARPEKPWNKTAELAFAADDMRNQMRGIPEKTAIETIDDTTNYLLERMPA